MKEICEKYILQGRYETRLLWKLDPTNLDVNYEIAENHLRGLNKRLKQDIWLFENYAEILNIR